MSASPSRAAIMSMFQASLSPATPGDVAIRDAGGRNPGCRKRLLQCTPPCRIRQRAAANNSATILSYVQAQAWALHSCLEDFIVRHRADSLDIYPLPCTDVLRQCSLITKRRCHLPPQSRLCIYILSSINLMKKLYSYNNIIMIIHYYIISIIHHRIITCKKLNFIIIIILFLS